MFRLALGALLAAAQQDVEFARLDRRFPEQFYPSLVNTFRLAEKWDALEVKIPQFDYSMRNVGLMVPGVTREFGTFSIYRRAQGEVEFLVESDQGHQWVNFDRPQFLSNRNKFLINADKAVYSFVDDFGFTTVYISSSSDEILSHAENRAVHMDRFGPPKPPQWMANMAQFVKPNRRVASIPSRTLSKRTPCQSEQCRTLSAETVDPIERIGACKCSSTDWSNLTARRCKLDENGDETDECFDCPATLAVSICGAWAPYETACSESCGTGTKQVGQCYTFYETNRNDANTLQCITTEEVCTEVCYNDCVCTSTDVSALAAEKCNVNDAADCVPCENTEACGVFETPVIGDCVADSGTCGAGTITTSNCFNWVDQADNECVDTTAVCDIECPPVYGACTCTSTDPANLSAQECDTNDTDNCRPCDPAVCGAFAADVVGACSATCGDGQKTVTSCFNWAASGDQTCTDSAVDCNEADCPKVCTCQSTDKDNLAAKLCNADGSACTDDCDVSVCGAFDDDVTTDCSVTCGGGSQSVTKCFVWSEGDRRECADTTQDCNTDPCPKVCTCQSTDKDNLTAKLCNEDGSACTDDCNTDVCGTLEETATECSVTCGGGTLSFDNCFVWANGDRECSDGTRACNEDACPKVCTCQSTDKDNLSAKLCNEDGSACTDDCDVATACGAYTQWAEWSTCSATCGGGVKSRERCFEWADENVNDECVTDDVACNEQSCPAWAAWRPWSSCSENCKASADAADPVETRYRCWNDGFDEKCSDCGLATDAECINNEERACNTQVCDGVCVWSEWGAYGACTPECEDGIKIRRRTGTDSCTESSIMTASCATDYAGVTCDSCVNKFDRCSSIPQRFCSDVRYKDQLENACAKYCNFCTNARRRRMASIVGGGGDAGAAIHMLNQFVEHEFELLSAELMDDFDM